MWECCIPLLQTFLKTDMPMEEFAVNEDEIALHYEGNGGIYGVIAF